MFMLKLFTYFLLLQLITARFTPKFNGQDSAIIVDADKPLPTNLNPKLQNALYYNYPVYHLIKQQNKHASQKTTTTTTTTTEAPLLTPINGHDDEFPSDLLYIAQHKLGLKRLDEIPSISELGELLGTANADETIKYIRQLTDTEQGIALMKAYIESSDYTDSSSNIDSDAIVDIEDIATEAPQAAITAAADEAAINAAADEENNDDDVDDTADIAPDNNEAINDIYDATIAEAIPSTTSTTKTPTIKPNAGLLQRFSNFLNSYKLWPETPPPALETTTAAIETTKTTTKIVTMPKAVPSANMPAFRPIFLPVPAGVQRQAMQTNFMPAHKPMLLRQPLPYHYPIPIRPILLQSPTTQTTQTKAPVHLNTAKVQQLAVETGSSNKSDDMPTEEVVHLNTAKVQQLTVETGSSSISKSDDIPTEEVVVRTTTVAPHVQQLAAMANVSAKKLEQFLQRKPKLAELAVRVSSLPMRQQNNGALDAQILSAVQRAIEQSGDVDIKKLLTDTLK